MKPVAINITATCQNGHRVKGSLWIVEEFQKTGTGEVIVRRRVLYPMCRECGLRAKYWERY